MEANSNLYQNPQFDDAGSSGPVKWSAQAERLQVRPIIEEVRPKPVYPKIDELKDFTDLG